MADRGLTTRFAPSPTGPLHLGHAYSALLAHDRARATGGRFLLRIEDIDRQRSRPHWESQIYEDLEWLGITWDEAPARQSDRMALYDEALDRLWDRGLIYPCSCTRKDVELAISAPQEGVATGPDGLVYPGTCRHASDRTGPRPRGAHLRLDMVRAVALGGVIGFTETGPMHVGHIVTHPTEYVGQIGDIILARRDFRSSYHLSVVIDDAAQAVSEVIRGEDLFTATAIHALLQKLLELPTPTYWHHKLIRDDNGKRLAKRDDARAILRYRQDGASPDDIRRMVGL